MHQVTIRANYRAAELAVHAGEKKARGEIGAEEDLRSAKNVVGATLTDTFLLRIAGEAGARIVGQQVWNAKHARAFLEIARKAGYDKNAILEVSEEWGIRPPLELVTPQPPLPEESIVGLEAEFVRNAQQALRDFFSKLDEIRDRELRKAFERTYTRKELTAAETAIIGSELEIAIRKAAENQGLDINALIAKSSKLLATLCEQQNLNPTVAVVVISSSRQTTDTFLDIAMRI